jgi:glycosyltransferase involved in cell wall biosynthesis
MEQSAPRNEQDVDISFFVPCLNEEKNVVNTLRVIMAATAKTGVSHEILVVDDASEDATVATVEAFQREHPEVPVVLVKNEVNQGLGINYLRTAPIARGKYYMLVNGDNVEREEVVTALLERIGQADIIIPYFGKLDNRPWFRIAVSRTFTFIVNLLSGNHIGYYNGAVVHLRENVIKWHPGTRGFAYEAELITILLSQGATCVQIEVPSEERQHGASKAFRLKNFISVAGSLMRIAKRRLYGTTQK